MLHYVFLASNRSPLELALMALGALVPIGSLVFGIWYALKRRAEKKRKQEKDDDLALSGKLSALQTAVGQLDVTTTTTKEQYQQFRGRVETSLTELKKQVAELQAQHIIYQHSTDVSDLEKEVERLTARVDRVADDLVKHRELVNDRFLTIESYKSDLLMWTNAFDSIRQDVRAITLSIKRSKS